MDLYDRQLGAIRRVAERAITVRDITVESVWGPSPQDGASSAAGRMLSEGFDIAPIIETPLWRYVTKDTLVSLPPDTPVAEVASTISASDLVTSSLPLADALQLLDEREWFFVIDGHEIKGILTIADLQSLTVSLVVLGFILAAEVGVDALIDRHLGDRWQSLLTDERLAEVDSVFAERQSRNAEIDRVSCLNLNDRLRILCKSSQLRSIVDMSRSQLDRTAEGLKRLRDSLAHGDSVVDVRDDPREGIRTAQQARVFADRVWAAVSAEDRPQGDSSQP